jgi:pyrroline-5-carboxylate reductase
MIKNLVLVGCGHMGRAMLAPWLTGKAAQKIWVVEPEGASLRDKPVTLCTNAGGLPKDLNPEAIVFALRPQVIEQELPDYKRFSGSLFLSIAAGKKLETYQRHLGTEARVIRAMPNLAAKVHEAVVVMAAGAKATSPDRTVAEVLFSPLGKGYWLDNENLMDAATAVSGCGPAYFYLLADALAKGGEGIGFSRELAESLARQTLIGAAAFAKEDPHSVEELYQSVAVKGGMTEAALKVLQNNEVLQKLMENALKAALEQGRKLSS